MNEVKIRAYEIKLPEEQRPEDNLRFQCKYMVDKWQRLKSSAQPVVIGIKIADNALNWVKTNNTFLNTAVDFAINLLLRKWMLKKSGRNDAKSMPFELKT